MKKIYDNVEILNINDYIKCGFYNGIYSDLQREGDDYIREVNRAASLIIKNGTVYNGEFKSKYVNVVNGFRATTDTPQKHVYTVYVYGPSWIYGYGVEDYLTFPSCLQRFLNHNSPNTFKVINHGIRGIGFWNDYFVFKDNPPSEGDAVIFFIRRNTRFANFTPHPHLLMHKECNRRNIKAIFAIGPEISSVVNPSFREKALATNPISAFLKHKIDKELFLQSNEKYKYCKEYIFCIENGLPCIDLQPFFDRPHDMDEVFVNKNHWSHRGNSAITPTIGNMIIAPRLKKSTHKNVEKKCISALASLMNKVIINDDFNEYLNKYTLTDPGGTLAIGSIVMNANPFTYGHQYLVQESIQNVDVLYIFVVENDESFFTFKDRLALVDKGVEALRKSSGKKIHVIPSGKYLISSFTFPEYFTKETSNAPIDSSYDVLIFGAIIAKKMGIRCRFLGEEPKCNVTSSYNEIMKKYLPRLGIDVNIIPRNKIEDNTISASLVRKLLVEKDFESIKKYVPESTFSFIYKKYVNV